MEKEKMRRADVILTMVSVLFISSVASAEILTYKLLPGSTITPLYLGNPIGPTETLTGTFQWEWFPSGSSNTEAFDATSLSFESDSYTISLHTTPLNQHASSVAVDSSILSFYEAVDVTGLPMTTGAIDRYNTFGSYTGPALSPTTLLHDNLRIVESLNGGMYRAKIVLVAEQVPEPMTLSLLAFGGLILLRKRK